jgi:hypothetical protein
VSWFDSWSILENVRAITGINKNCRTTPTKIGFGSFTMRSMSALVSVSPIRNITVANSGTMAVLSAAKGAFRKNAIREISNAQRGKRVLNLASILNLLGV